MIHSKIHSMIHSRGFKKSYHLAVPFSFAVDECHRESYVTRPSRCSTSLALVVGCFWVSGVVEETEEREVRLEAGWEDWCWVVVVVEVAFEEAGERWMAPAGLRR